ncbi:hypothetical protein [Enterococcus sp. 5H]|uniref:hypothetical protein n=1 Tax=Enterococcus sp. 5H TaxID=1229490 RepID=UPI002303012B|nr:hypothetical protein [Enterococcus sp. 5H]
MMSKGYDEDQDKFIYRNISALRLIEDFVKNTHYLYFVTEGNEYELDTLLRRSGLDMFLANFPILLITKVMNMNGMKEERE